MFEALGIEGPRGRRLRLLAAGAALGLLLILLANALSPPQAALDPGPRAPLPEPAPGAPPGTTLAGYEEQLSARLTELLARVDGAGRVRAMVRLAAGEQAVVLQDVERSTRETGERDTQGGTRTITERTEAVRAVFADAARSGQPVVLRMEGAEVAGVLVVAEGAGDPWVRLRLLRAVQAVFPDVPAHRVEIVRGR